MLQANCDSNSPRKCSFQDSQCCGKGIHHRAVPYPEDCGYESFTDKQEDHYYHGDDNHHEEDNRLLHTNTGWNCVQETVRQAT